MTIPVVCIPRKSAYFFVRSTPMHLTAEYCILIQLVTGLSSILDLRLLEVYPFLSLLIIMELCKALSFTLSHMGLAFTLFLNH